MLQSRESENRALLARVAALEKQAGRISEAAGGHAFGTDAQDELTEEAIIQAEAELQAVATPCAWWLVDSLKRAHCPASQGARYSVPRHRFCR